MTTTLEVPRPERWYTEPQHLEVDGVALAHRRAGSGEPVLFLHGHWATRRWLPVHEALAGSVDLIAPEHPGFGETPAPAWSTGLADLVLFYRDALDALALPSAHLVGYGLGGWLAAELAVWFPERVRSLSLLAPYGLRVPGHPLANIFLMDPARFPDAYGLGTDLDDVVPGVGTPAKGGPEEFAHRYGEMGAAAKLMWQRRYDLKLETRLPRTRIPSLVVGAEHDQILPEQHLSAWAGLLDAATVVVPGAGHAFPLTAPDATAAAVADHVARSRSTAPRPTTPSRPEGTDR